MSRRPPSRAAPAGDIVGATGAGEISSLLTGSAGSGRVSLGSAQRRQTPPRAQRSAHRPQPDRGVKRERRGEHPGAVIVRSGEEERERVEYWMSRIPVANSNSASDQQYERQPFERVRGASQRRPLEQPGDHRPQLRQQDWKGRQPDRDAQPASARKANSDGLETGTGRSQAGPAAAPPNCLSAAGNTRHWRGIR